jgi:hypothetical protein
VKQWVPASLHCDYRSLQGGSPFCTDAGCVMRPPSEFTPNQHVPGEYDTCTSFLHWQITSRGAPARNLPENLSKAVSFPRCHPGDRPGITGFGQTVGKMDRK